LLIEITSIEHLNEVLSEHDRAILMLTQPSWCVPCRQLRKHIDRLVSEDDVVVAYTDLDDVPEAIDLYSVQGVPVLYEYQHNVLLRELKGRTVVQLRRELSNA
jgi:thiol-disulfide isomerase/thioredoxin